MISNTLKRITRDSPFCIPFSFYEDNEFDESKIADFVSYVLTANTDSRSGYHIEDDDPIRDDPLLPAALQTSQLLAFTHMPRISGIKTPYVYVSKGLSYGPLHKEDGPMVEFHESDLQVGESGLWRVCIKKRPQ